MEADRLFDLLFKRYISLSKNASRLFIALMSISVYMLLTIYSNNRELNRFEQSARTSISDSLHISLEQEVGPEFVGPVYSQSTIDSLEPSLVRERLSEKIESFDYTLPILSMHLPSDVFFFTGPLVYFIVTLFFWLFFKNSRDTLLYLTANTSSADRPMVLHLSMVDLPFTKTSYKYVWQICIEFMPIVFHVLLLVVYVHVTATNWATFVAVILVAPPLACHSAIFRPRFTDKEDWDDSRFYMIVYMSLFLYSVIVSNKSVIDILAPLDTNNLYELWFGTGISLLFLGFFETLLLGRKIIAGPILAIWTLPITLLYSIGNISYYVLRHVVDMVRNSGSPFSLKELARDTGLALKETLVENLKKVRLRRSSETAGYLGYLFDRFEEIKRINGTENSGPTLHCQE